MFTDGESQSPPPKIADSPPRLFGVPGRGVRDFSDRAAFWGFRAAEFTTKEPILKPGWDLIRAVGANAP